MPTTTHAHDSFPYGAADASLAISTVPPRHLAAGADPVSHRMMSPSGGITDHSPSFFLVNNDKKHHFAHAGLSAECLHSHSRDDTGIRASQRAAPQGDSRGSRN